MRTPLYRVAVTLADGRHRRLVVAASSEADAAFWVAQLGAVGKVPIVGVGEVEVWR